MPKEPTALASRMTILRRALEILRVVWPIDGHAQQEATIRCLQAGRTKT
jgi:hypothetical protein